MNWDELPFTPYCVYPPCEPTQEEKDNILPKSDLWKQEMSDRMTGESNPMWRKTTSQKQKDTVSKSMKGKKKKYKVVVPKTVLYGADNPKSKPVTIDGVTYPTHSACAKALGIPRSTVTYRINRGIPVI